MTKVLAGLMASGATVLLAVMASSAGAQTAPAPPAAAPAASCAPQGAVRFICGHAGPEDLVQVPGTRWVVVSSFAKQGLKLVDSRTWQTTTLYPAADSRVQFDSRTYAGCPGPLSAAETAAFQNHGIALQRRRGGGFTLYASHHGERESIEVFNLDLIGGKPRATWIGCVVAPMPIGLNSLVPLPDGGFITTNFRQRGPGEAEARALMAAGKNNAELYEWHPGGALVKVPGSEASGPNGIELSRDGKWIYFAGWGSQTIERLSRGKGPIRRTSVPVGFKLDNLRFGPDGQIYGAGQPDDSGARVIRVDPVTMKVTPLLTLPHTPEFHHGTAAIRVGRDVWVGSAYGDRIAVFTPGK